MRRLAATPPCCWNNMILARAPRAGAPSWYTRRSLSRAGEHPLVMEALKERGYFVRTRRTWSASCPSSFPVIRGGRALLRLGLKLYQMLSANTASARQNLSRGRRPFGIFPTSTRRPDGWRVYYDGQFDDAAADQPDDHGRRAWSDAAELRQGHPSEQRRRRSDQRPVLGRRRNRRFLLGRRRLS